MRVRPRLLAVISFVAVGILALMVAGILDWIVGVLFLSMEFLGEVLRNVFRRRSDRRRLSSSRSRHPSVGGSLHPIEGRGGSLIRRKGRPRRKRARHREGEPDSPPAATTPEQRLRILVPVSGDDRDLIDFALEESKRRRAEMILLFLRPMGVTPMGPNELPGLAEDDEARSTFDRVSAEAERLGVPFRNIHMTTNDLATTIGEVARKSEAEVVIVGSTRKSGLFRFLSRDLAPSLIKCLPERTNLTIHRSRPGSRLAKVADDQKLSLPASS